MSDDVNLEIEDTVDRLLSQQSLSEDVIRKVLNAFSVNELEKAEEYLNLMNDLDETEPHLVWQDWCSKMNLLDETDNNPFYT